MKFLKITAIIGVAFIGIYLIARFTGIFSVYTIPTVVNEPTIKQGTILNTTNLKDPVNGDFVVFSKDTAIYISRLIAKGGDKVLIKQGVVYVNDKNTDKGLTLNHNYSISETDYRALSKEIEFKYGYNDFTVPYAQNPTKQFNVILEDKVAERFGLTHKRAIAPIENPDRYIYTQFRNAVNKDNIGPVIVPHGKLFVIGDNRDNSEDSRYYGFVNESDIKGVVLQ